MIKRICVALFMVCILLFSAGCTNLAKEIVKQAEQGASAAAIATEDPSISPTPEPTPELMDDVEKFNAYIVVSNLLNDRMNLCLEGYVNRICELDQEYSVNKKDFKGWINSIGEYELKKLTTAQEYAAVAPAIEPVDSAYLALAPIAIRVTNTLSEVYNYYETKGYVDDDFAQGQILHDALADDMESFFSLSDEFLTVLNEVSHERTLTQLEVFKEDGRVILYYANVFMLEAEDICLYLGNADTEKNKVVVAEEDYRILYDRLAATHAEFTQVATDEQAKAEGIDLMFSSYKSAVNDFKAEAAGIAQKLGNGKEISISDLNDLIDEYSDMIDDYNRLIR